MFESVKEGFRGGMVTSALFFGGMGVAIMNAVRLFDQATRRKETLAAVKDELDEAHRRIKVTSEAHWKLWDMIDEKDAQLQAYGKQVSDLQRQYERATENWEVSAETRTRAERRAQALENALGEAQRKIVAFEAENQALKKEGDLGRARLTAALSRVKDLEDCLDAANKKIAYLSTGTPDPPA